MFYLIRHGLYSDGESIHKVPSILFRSFHSTSGRQCIMPRSITLQSLITLELSLNRDVFHALNKLLFFMLTFRMEDRCRQSLMIIHYRSLATQQLLPTIHDCADHLHRRDTVRPRGLYRLLEQLVDVRIPCCPCEAWLRTFI